MDLRRIAFALALSAGPLCSACELAFDFDRSPLNPEPEAGVEDGVDASLDALADRSAEAAADGGRDASTVDAKTDAADAEEGG